MRYFATLGMAALTIACCNPVTRSVAQETRSHPCQYACSGSSTEAPQKQKAIAIIQGPVVVGTGDTWAVISWTTNAGGYSIIHAGTNKSNLNRRFQSLQVDGESVQQSYQEQEYSHLVRIGNLKSLTTYYFVADSGHGKAASVESRSDILQFTTKATIQAQTRRAVAMVQEPTVRSTGNTWVVIVWTTNVETSSIVQYGIDRNNLSQTIGLSYVNNRKTHRVRVDHLTPGTTYYFVAESAQSGGIGREATSTVAQFTTKSLCGNMVFFDPQCDASVRAWLRVKY